jgi:hypothetical protein
MGVGRNLGFSRDPFGVNGDKTATMIRSANTERLFPMSWVGRNKAIQNIMATALIGNE